MEITLYKIFIISLQILFASVIEGSKFSNFQLLTVISKYLLASKETKQNLSGFIVLRWANMKT